MKKTPKISKTDDSDLEENLIDELEDENSGVQIDSSRKQTRKPSKASNVAKMLQFMEKNEEVRQAQQKTRTDEKREERIAKQKRHEERMEAQTRLLEILAASLPKKEEKRKSKKKKRDDSSSSEE